jgi:hypothetical protein
LAPAALPPGNNAIEPAPALVEGCKPCSLHLGNGLPAFTADFELALSGDERLVKAIVVKRADKPSWSQRLVVPDMTPVEPGSMFFFGVTDIDFDGHGDLLLATERGVANTFADYWLFSAQTAQFSRLGNFPLLKVDPEKKQLSSFERGGAGGNLYASKQWAFEAGALRVVESEQQDATADPNVFRRTVSRLQNGRLTVVQERRVPAAK